VVNFEWAFKGLMIARQPLESSNSTVAGEAVAVYPFSILVLDFGF